MNDLVYPRERVLRVFTLLIGLLIWLLLVIGTFGIALVARCCWGSSSICSCSRR